MHNFRGDVVVLRALHIEPKVFPRSEFFLKKQTSPKSLVLQMKALVEYYSWDQCPVLLFKKCEALTGNCGVYFILTAFSIFIEYAVAFCQCLFTYPSDFMPEEKYEGGVAFSESSPKPASLSLARGSLRENSSNDSNTDIISCSPAGHWPVQSHFLCSGLFCIW